MWGLSLKPADALRHKRCRISGSTSFRALKGYRLLQDIYEGKKFVDREAVHEKKIVERMAA